MATSSRALEWWSIAPDPLRTEREVVDPHVRRTVAEAVPADDELHELAVQEVGWHWSVPLIRAGDLVHDHAVGPSRERVGRLVAEERDLEAHPLLLGDRQAFVPEVRLEAESVARDFVHAERAFDLSEANLVVGLARILA